MRTDPAPEDGGETSRRRVLAGITAGVSGTFLSGRSLADPGVPRLGRSTRPRYDRIDVIRENVWVETHSDTDGTGRRDRVHVEVARPAATEDGDTTVPVVVRPTPYRTPDPDRIDGPRGLPDDLPEDVAEFHASLRDMKVELYRPGDDTDGSSDGSGGHLGAPRRTPGSPQDERFYYERKLLPEGYAFAYVSPIGSSLSTGCNLLGGPAEVESVRSVVDWLNGRATAYDAREGGETVLPDWTTGTTGMLGGSYRGALANGVATTGVEGLETIVPIRAMSSWYTYVRSNGAVITPGNDRRSQGANLALFSGVLTTRKDHHLCDDVIVETATSTDPDSGNYNDFWEARDYVLDASDVRASVLIVHGLYDEEVRPINASQWLDALGRNDVPYRVWLHQGGHGDPKDRHEDRWLALLERWFDHWLKGEDNGVMNEPAAVLEREDGSLVEEADWPHPESQPTSLGFDPGGEEMGTLALSPSADAVTESLVDDSDVPPVEFLGTDNADHRLVYRTLPFTEPVRVSGTIRPRLRLSFDSPAALVSVGLVDYGPDGAEIVNRGWMNPQNRESLRESLPLTPGEPYRIEFPTQPVDYVFEPDHRLGFVLYSSDYNVTKRPPSTPELTLHLDESTLDVPVVGGESALSTAMADEEPGNGDPDTTTDSAGDTTTTDGTGSTTTDDGDTPTGDDDGTPAGDTPTGDGEGTPAGDGVPGFGVASALAGIGGLGYLLKRRFDQE